MPRHSNYNNRIISIVSVFLGHPVLHQIKEIKLRFLKEVENDQLIIPGMIVHTYRLMIAVCFTNEISGVNSVFVNPLKLKSRLILTLQGV